MSLVTQTELRWKQPTLTMSLVSHKVWYECGSEDKEFIYFRTCINAKLSI